MPYLGPFFYINNRLITNKCTLNEARLQADKLDNSYGHDMLYDDYFKNGDYIFFPRGRVIWDKSNDRAIIYIDSSIHKSYIINAIVKEFELDKFVIEYDEHYNVVRF